MRPRNDREREVIHNYVTLPRLTKSQWDWVKDSIDRRIFTTGRKCWCTQCGGEWDDKLEGEFAMCPHCGAKSEVQRGRHKVFRGFGYAQFLHVHKGWQVIRYTLIRWECKIGREAKIYDMDVIQKWCQPGKPAITLGTQLGFACYWRRIPYSLWGRALSVKPNHSYFYTEWMECKTYPRRSFLPVYTKNLGKNPSFALIDAPTLLGDIFGCPYFESLYKAGETKKLADVVKYTDEFNKYWPSVKVALRHGYEPAHWGSYWEHLRALKFLRYDMRSPRYVAPPDFGQLHDLIMRQYRNKIDERDRKIREANQLRWAIQEEELQKQREEDAKRHTKSFMERIAHFAGLHIEDKDIVISPLMSIEAFKDEGNAMHHCVFTMGYYKNPDSLILSARSRKDNERVETIEVSLRDFTIRQSMGIYNSHTERHDEIVNLVNDAMPQIREMARAI